MQAKEPLHPCTDATSPHRVVSSLSLPHEQPIQNGAFDSALTLQLCMPLCYSPTGRCTTCTNTRPSIWLEDSTAPTPSPPCLALARATAGHCKPLQDASNVSMPLPLRLHLQHILTHNQSCDTLTTIAATKAATTLARHNLSTTPPCTSSQHRGPHPSPSPSLHHRAPWPRVLSNSGVLARPLKL